MTEDAFLVLITIIAIIGLLISAIIWWVGSDIKHQLRYKNFLLNDLILTLKEKNEEKL